MGWATKRRFHDSVIIENKPRFELVDLMWSISSLPGSQKTCFSICKAAPGSFSPSVFPLANYLPQPADTFLAITTKTKLLLFDLLCHTLFLLCSSSRKYHLRPIT